MPPTRRGGVSMKHTHNNRPRWIDAPMAEPEEGQR
jgi:hypothetical protein